MLVSQWFAPTTLVISFEKRGLGRFTDEEVKNIVERDSKGRVVNLHLPQKAVLIANHQVGMLLGGCCGEQALTVLR